MSQDMMTALELYNCLQREKSSACAGVDEMQSHFGATDAALAKLLETSDDAGEDAFSLKRIFSMLEHVRGKATERTLNRSVIKELYDENLVRPAYENAVVRLLGDAKFIPERANSLLNLLEWHRLTCAERDEGANAQADKSFDAQKMQLLADLAAKQSAYERMFMASADDGQRNAFVNLKNSRSPDNMDEKINEAISTQLRDGYGLSSFLSMDWRSVFDAKCGFLFAALKSLSLRVFDVGEERQQPSAVQQLDAEVENNLHQIRNLPLFVGLSSKALRDVLGTARIASYDRDSLFLVQGEAVSRFFVMLEGTAKIFKSDAEGREAILNIVGKKECVWDADPLRSGVCPVSARTLGKAKLLSMPASAMNGHMSSYRELAQNAFSLANQRLQKLVAQMEQLTLRSAEQRVGWFLLTLHINSGSGGGDLHLPFDKALIASYLNIKPETFSRILNNFKKKGFKIERQILTMPNPRALCEYCDNEMASKCCASDSLECRFRGAPNALKRMN